MKKFLFTAIIVFAMATPSKSFSWGKRGYDMVAQVAYNYLDTNSRKILIEYLDGMTIQEAANWTDENNAYFLCIIPAHPLTNSILGQEDDLSRTKDKIFEFNSLSDINSYLSLSASEIGDRDREAIKEKINPTIQTLVKYCVEPKSRDEIFEEIGLYKNTKNFQNHIKPLIDVGWLYYSLPNKLTSRDQKYYTTELGKKLLEVLSLDGKSQIKRIPVASSNIASIGYDVENKILEIEFHHGAVYQYFDVLDDVYEELMSSAAIGSYFMNEIKSKFEFKKM